jgi:hypothetical protein
MRAFSEERITKALKEVMRILRRGTYAAGSG